MLPRTYNHLNGVQKGFVGEAYTKMAFTLSGFEVYTSEYDDRGIDFVVRSSRGAFYSAQVKTTGPTVNPFIYEKKFHLIDEFLFIAVRLEEGIEPAIYMAKGSEWENPRDCFHYNADGGTAGAYYELRFGKLYAESLRKLQFENYLQQL